MGVQEGTSTGDGASRVVAGDETLQAYATFLRRLGHRLHESESARWYDAQPGFYFYFPYHRLIEPSDDELRRLLLGRACIGARYFTPTSAVGKESYLVVCADRHYDLASLDKHSARRETLRGLENSLVRRLGLVELAEVGSSLYQDTLTRQGRDPQLWSAARWRRYCDAAGGLPGFDAWGAHVGDELAAFMLGFQFEDHFTILHHCSATHLLPSHPNNALVYTVTRAKLTTPGVTAVSYGPQSLDAPASLDAFKFRMGYRRRPMKQAIVFNPLVRPFVGGASHGVVRAASHRCPRSDTLRKLDGILSFYREAA